jgi:tRNA-dihydrouridine synthase
VDRRQVSPDAVQDLIRTHLEGMLEFYGAERGLVLFRKYASRYISPYPLERPDRIRLFSCEKVDELLAIIDEITAGTPPADLLATTQGQNFWRPFQR